MAKAKKVKTPQQILKDFCIIIAALGVTRINATYDGSGDSGDFDDITFHFGGASRGDETDYAFHANHNHGMSLYSFKQLYIEAVEETRQIIKLKQLDEFTEALFYFLPGGWEIDEGSFGEIVLDVKNGKLEHEHNERVTETRTSHNEYTLTPQDQAGDENA